MKITYCHIICKMCCLNPIYIVMKHDHKVKSISGDLCRNLPESVYSIILLLISLRKYIHMVCKVFQNILNKTYYNHTRKTVQFRTATYVLEHKILYQQFHIIKYYLQAVHCFKFQSLT